jgi:4-amino-4-deoxy-L-arabinose transferase-like glycosyltransferase
VSHRSRRTFGIALGIVVLVGILVRVAYIRVVGPHTRLWNDSGWYFSQASNILHGRGYLDVGRQFAYQYSDPSATRLVPGAFWPPGYPVFLAGVEWLFGPSWYATRMAGVATGGATVLLVGLLGRAIAGRAVGVVAALLVALSPLMLATDGSLMSETLYVPLVLLALLIANQARNRAALWWWALLGVLVGIATLTRQDALLLVPCAVIPAALLSRASACTIATRIAVSVIVTGAAVAPWIARNAIVLGDATITTGSQATAIGGANCAVTYHGPAIGFWDGACAGVPQYLETNEVEFSRRARRRGISYAEHHVTRLPVVATARFARVWGLWNPADQALRERMETRNRTWQELMWPVSIVTLVLGLLGFRVLARDKRPIAMLIAPMAMTTIVAVATYGNTRFRAPAECALAIGAAALLVHAWRWLEARDASATQRAER